VTAEVMYHVIQRNMSLGDTGAFRASASSCAFSLTLPVLVLNRLMASLTLFLGLWPCGGGRHWVLDFLDGHFATGGPC
jgi:hypothetical protein